MANSGEYWLIVIDDNRQNIVFIAVSWYTYPLKNDGVKVSWDDDIPNWMENNPNVPNHQLEYM